MTQTDKSDGPSVSKVLTYWFGSDPESIDLMKAQKKVWYRGGSKVDQQIKEEFGTTIEALEMGRLLEWGETAKGGLALVIVLDQFSRHVYRGTREAFVQDPLARAIARRLVGRRLDMHLSVLVFPDVHLNVGVGGREARTRDECQARGAGARWAGLSSVRACVRYGTFGAKRLQNL